jgi:hypothetical protein
MIEVDCGDFKIYELVTGDFSSGSLSILPTDYSGNQLHLQPYASETHLPSLILFVSSISQYVMTNAHSKGVVTGPLGISPCLKPEIDPSHLGKLRCTMFDDIYPPNGCFQGPDRGAVKDSPARMLAC